MCAHNAVLQRLSPSVRARLAVARCEQKQELPAPALYEAVTRVVALSDSNLTVLCCRHCFGRSARSCTRVTVLFVIYHSSGTLQVLPPRTRSKPHNAKPAPLSRRSGGLLRPRLRRRRLWGVVTVAWGCQHRACAGVCSPAAWWCVRGLPVLCRHLPLRPQLLALLHLPPQPATVPQPSVRPPAQQQPSSL